MSKSDNNEYYVVVTTVGAYIFGNRDSAKVFCDNISDEMSNTYYADIIYNNSSLAFYSYSKRIDLKETRQQFEDLMQEFTNRFEPTI